MVAFNVDAFSAPADDAYSAPSETNEQSYSDIVAALEAAKVHLDKSSKGLLKCSSSAEFSDENFICLRSELTMLAVVYKDLHLSLATKVVTDLRDAIMLYAECDVKKFKKNVRGIEKSMSEQAVSVAVMTRVNGLLLLNLNVLHIHMDKKMVFIDAAASMKCCDAFNTLKEAKRVKERHYAEDHDVEKVKVRVEMAGGAATVVGMLAVLPGAPVVVAVGGVAGAAVGMGGFVSSEHC